MKRALAGVLLAVALIVGAVYTFNVLDEDDIAGASIAAQATPEQIARGAYLARAGNCIGCHTERGGAPYAGGRGIDTPFGTVYASNLTPDPKTGIGQWNAAHLWRALHNGRSRDGRLLYPAFPYPNYTHITRADADAIYAYLRCLPALEQPNRAHALRFPYDTQAALAVWRALYFRPARHVDDGGRPAEWNRGAYLVEGLGHCNACHASRNLLGATAGPLDLGGGLIPVQNWYAPSLTSALEAGVAHWDRAQVVALLKTGVSAQASVVGPMAEVVLRSTQYLSEADLNAIASYLQSLPPGNDKRDTHAASARAAELFERGLKVYEQHCVSCHGADGDGVTGAYPRLAGNRAVTLDPPANLVHVVLGGGFPPATAGNPRPYGMPPFATVLGNDEIAAVVSYMRGAWGNRGSTVTPLDVSRYRSGRRD